MKHEMKECKDSDLSMLENKHDNKSRAHVYAPFNQCEKWNADRIDNYGITLNVNTITSTVGSMWQSAHGLTVCEPPHKNSWKIKVEFAQHSGILLGVIDNDFEKITTDMYNGHLFYSCGSIGPHSSKEQYRYSYGSPKVYGKALKHKDIVDIHLDLKQCELSFDINGNSCGVAANNLCNKRSYNLVVSTYQKGIKATLLSANKTVQT
eukprot:887132_1